MWITPVILLHCDIIPCDIISCHIMLVIFCPYTAAPSWTISTFSAFPLMAQWNSRQFHLCAAWKYYERDPAYSCIKNHAVCVFRPAACGFLCARLHGAYSRSRSKYVHAAHKWNCWAFNCAISENAKKVVILVRVCSTWCVLRREAWGMRQCMNPPLVSYNTCTIMGGLRLDKTLHRTRAIINYKKHHYTVYIWK